MAAAVAPSIMSLNEHKPVHPFFERPQNVPSIRSSTSSHPRSAATTRSSAAEVGPQGSNERLEGPLEGEEAQGHGIFKKRKRKRAKRAVNGAEHGLATSEGDSGTVAQEREPDTLQDTGPNGQDGMHRTMTSTHLENYNIHEASLDHDRPVRRRKRRKISSAEDNLDTLPRSDVSLESKVPARPASYQDNWLDQLRLHASGVLLHSDTNNPAEASMLAEGSNACASSTAITPGLPSSPPRVAIPPDAQAKVASKSVNGESLADPTYPMVRGIADTAELETRQPAGRAESRCSPMRSEGQQPTRKMLRLNKKGRFSSPVATTEKAMILATEAKRRPGRPKKNTRPPHLVVIISYGKDTATKARVAQRIEDIRSGSGVISQTLMKPPKVETDPTKPMKPTHPFFLGKCNQEQAQELKETGTIDPGKQNSSGAIHPTARKSAVTPGKLRSEALRASNAALSAEIGPPSEVKARNSAGGLEPPWPTSENVHVRGVSSTALTGLSRTRRSHDNQTFDRRKLKGNIVSIDPRKDLLYLTRCKLDLKLPRKPNTLGACRVVPKTLRLAEKLILSGPELQKLVGKQMRATVSGPILDLASSHYSHPALSHIYCGIPDHLTAFNKGQCETLSWAQKYAPKSAQHVLQCGKELTVLRKWLQSHTISTTDSRTTESNIKAVVRRPALLGPAKPGPRKRRRKRRRKAGELADFLVSTDEEADDMGEGSGPDDEVSLSDASRGVKRSIVRTSEMVAKSATSNTILLSGPSGCGKSAAVYAVAKELGFEVFEINSSSRRSGKDVLDRVGDVTRNHLVHQDKLDTATEAADDAARLDADFERDLSNGRQGTMQSFFKSSTKTSAKHLRKEKSRAAPKAEKETVHKPQPHKRQKQSLILLEEVDILFEEDKQFWMTVLSLCSTSKRPIIMTCNDETLLPVEECSFHAILRLTPPPIDLATDYLLLMSANEGHVLDRDAVTALFEARRQDLRATVMDLDFWCQIGVGAERRGWDWILPRWPPGKNVNGDGQALRIASGNTYRKAMGWFGRDHMLDDAHTTLEKEEELLLEAWDEWDLDIRDRHAFKPSIRSAASAAKDSRKARVEDLRRIESLLESKSALDVFSRVGLPTGNEVMDTTQPVMAEKTRLSYIEGLPLLEATPLDDPTRFDTRIAVTTHLFAHRNMQAQQQTFHSSNNRPSSPSILEDEIVTDIIDRVADRQKPALARSDFSTAFDPISEPSVGPGSLSQPGFQTSSFDREFSVICTDLAPYVRSIVSYDLELEARRSALSSLLSENGRDGKKVRTTRASRSALEGGRRETTRRERWFGKGLNPQLVMRTGGQWPIVEAVQLPGNGDSGTERGSERGSSTGKV